MKLFACILLLASGVNSYLLGLSHIKFSSIRKYSTYIRLNSNDDNNQIIEAVSNNNEAVDLTLLDSNAQPDNVVLDPKASNSLKEAEQNRYTVIASATLSDDNKVLKFGPNVFDLMSIYIHPSWPLLYERIRRNLITYKKNHIVVTGSPGLGKSMFSYYYIWRAITEENCTSFLYEEQPKDVELHSEADVSLITNTLECPTGLPFFVDMIGTKAEPSPKPVRLSAYTIIFSSPDNSRFKDFLKHRNSIKYLLEPWTEEEVYEAWHLVSSFSQVPKEVVASQYAMYGGVPRFVFQRAAEGEGPMRPALSVTGEEAARNMFTIRVADGDVEMQTLFHMRTKPPSSATIQLGDFEIFVPASPFVVRELSLAYPDIMMGRFWEAMRHKPAGV